MNNPNENYNILEEEISNSLEIHMNKKQLNSTEESISETLG